MNEQWAGSAEREAVKGAALIDKAFQVIDIVGASPGHVSVQKLAQETGWARPTLYRILSAITASGFLRLDPVAQGYTLGYRFLELAQNVWSGPDLAAVASVELRRLRDITGETAYLAVPHNGAMVALGKFEGTHSVRSAAKLGIRKPMHCTSQGKAVLAFLPRDEADKLLNHEELTRFTPYTIIDPAQLRAHLSIVRQRGYAVEDEEIIVGNRCVGAPILDNFGKPIAAISVAGPTWRLTSERVEQLGPEVLIVARNIGAQLRSSPPASGTDAQRSIVQLSTGKPAFYAADPMWDNKRQTLTWTDRLGPAIFEMSGTTSKSVRLPHDAPIRAAGLSAQDLLIWQTDKRSAWFKGEIRSAKVHNDAESCATHPDGKLWTSRMEGEGSRIAPVDADGNAGWLTAGHITSLAWSPDGTRLYAADAEKGTIYYWEPGSKSARIFSRLPRVSGEPRGIAIDGRGRVWAALYDGWSVAHLSEDGEIETVCALPVPRPTGLAFGGEGMRELFITSARVGLSREVLENAPLSGHVLRLSL